MRGCKLHTLYIKLSTHIVLVITVAVVAVGATLKVQVRVLKHEDVRIEEHSFV